MSKMNVQTLFVDKTRCAKTMKAFKLLHFTLIGLGLCITSGLFAPASSQRALTALESYWNGSRTDNFTTGTDLSRKSAVDTNYSYLRVEGCAFLKPQPNTVPLELYWNAQSGDNFSTATGHQDAINAGYTYVRTEGYIYATQQPGTVPLWLFWNSQEQDNYVTATQEGADSAYAAGYSYLRVEGYVYPNSNCSK